MTDKNWRDLGRGSGNRPEGIQDSQLVRRKASAGGGWFEMPANQCEWFDDCEYQVLEPSPTADRAEVLREALKALVEAYVCNVDSHRTGGFYQDPEKDEEVVAARAALATPIGDAKLPDNFGVDSPTSLQHDKSGYAP